MKTDASVGDARVRLDLFPAYPELWVTAYVFLDTAAAAFFAGQDSGYLFTLQNGPILGAVSLLTNEWALSGVVGEPLLSGDSPSANVWMKVEYRRINGDECRIYIDDTLIVAATDAAGSDVDQLRIGQNGTLLNDPASVVYFKNITIGTTQGGNDVFEWLETETDLSSWSGVTGAVSVVTDPMPGEETLGAGGVRVSIAFDDPPLEPDPTWTDLTVLSGCHVQAWTVDRGRPDEFAKTGTGTATLRIADELGLFDPTNGSGPYFGMILPDRQAMIELHDPVLDEWHVVFRGFVEDWQYDLELTEQVFFVDVALVDGFAILNDAELMPYPDAGDPPAAASEGRVFYEDQSAGTVRDRILAILADIGWPSALYSIFSGNVRVTETVYEPGTEALAALFDAADAEFPGVANLYMSKDGILTFHGRQARFRPDVAQYGINRRDVGDPSVTDADATICPVHELGFNLGKASLFNSVLVVPQDTTVGIPPTEAEIAGQLVEDATSIAAHGKKGLSFTDLLTLEGIATSNTALAETMLMATYFRDNYKDPLPRVNRMVFKTRTADHRLAGPLWKMLTRVEISDLLTLTTAHPGGGGFSEDGYYVEGIHYDCRPLTGEIPHVVLTLDVSPQAFFTVNPFDGDPDPDA